MDKVYTINEIKTMIFPLMKEYRVKKCILFGSYAKGFTTSRSDIDLVVDSDGYLLNIKFYGLLEDLVETFNKKIDLIEITEIREGGEADKAIKKEGIVIYER